VPAVPARDCPNPLVDAVCLAANGEAILSPSITRRLIQELLRHPARLKPGRHRVCGSAQVRLAPGIVALTA